MQPTFQTSFIPKKQTPNESAYRPSISAIKQNDILSIIATILFIASVIVYGGLYAYRLSLKNQIKDLDQRIEKVKTTFQIDKIKEIIDSNNRLSSAKLLLETHTTLSQMLVLFQDLTIKKIKLLDLIYLNKDGALIVNLSTESLSYNALIEQSRAFSETEYLKNGKFSNFSLQENGNIKADFQALVDKKLISYKEIVDPSEEMTRDVDVINEIEQ